MESKTNQQPSTMSNDADDDNSNGKRKGGSATTVRPAHTHTNAPQIGGGHSAMAKKLAASAAAAAAAAGGVGDVGGGGGAKRALWDVTSVAPKWVPPPALQLAGKRAVAPHAVTLALECVRATALERLRKKLNAAAAAAGAGAPPPQGFERWRFAAKLAEDAAAAGGAKAAALDPVIPSAPPPSPSSSSSGGGGGGSGVLTGDLERAGVTPEAAKTIAEQIIAAAAADAAALRKLHSRLTSAGAGTEPTETKKDTNKATKTTAPTRTTTTSASANANANANARTTVTVQVHFRKHSVELTASKGGHFVVLSRRAYGKLAAMYRRNTPSVDPGLPPLSDGGAGAAGGAGEDGVEDDDDDDVDGECGGVEGEEVAAAAAAAAAADGDGDGVGAAPPACDGRRAFHARLFALLLRYKSIQGYGFQASVGPEVFRALRAATGAAFECFASPLNTFFGRFCGAFPDVDAPFGSSGDFFALPAAALRRGCFQANPPFVSAVMTAMAARVATALAAAEQAEQPLSFVIFVPGWTDEASWGAMKSSGFLRSHFVVAAGDHGYCDGAAHQRRDAYRASVYDTGVFVLQSSRAAASAVGRHVAAGPKSRDGGGGGGALATIGRFEAEVREAMAGARLAAVGVAAAAVAAKKGGAGGGGGGEKKRKAAGGGTREADKQGGGSPTMKEKKKKIKFDADEDEDVAGGEEEKDKARVKSKDESKDEAKDGAKKDKTKKDKKKKDGKVVENKAAKKRRKRREAAAAAGVDATTAKRDAD